MSIDTEAYVARPPAPPRLEKVTYPALGPHEVLVDIVASSICHSDIRAAAGSFYLTPPLIIGHEGSGYVRSVGSGVTYVKPGDAVVLAFASCMKCRKCEKGSNAYCEKVAQLNFGGKRDDGSAAVTASETGEELNGFFFGQSCMARVALVREESCVKFGDVTREDLKIACCLGCGVMTGAGTIMNIAKPPPGSSIAIFGGGGVGLSALLAAQLTSPGCIVLVDNSQTKLDIIPRSIIGPNTRLYNSADKSNEQVTKDLRSLTPGARGLNYAIDCVGNEDIVKIGHAALDTLGTLITIGSGSKSTIAGYSLSQHLLRGITHRGTHQGDSVPRETVPKLFRMWKDSQFPFDKLLAEFEFEDMEKAKEEMRKGNVIKPVLVV
ncbi:unnamed protein product [Discula destructiva]